LIRKFFFAVLLTFMIAFYDVGTVVSVSEHNEYRTSAFFEAKTKPNKVRNGGKAMSGSSIAATKYRIKSR